MGGMKHTHVEAKAFERDRGCITVVVHIDRLHATTAVDSSNSNIDRPPLPADQEENHTKKKTGYYLLLLYKLSCCSKR